MLSSVERKKKPTPSVGWARVVFGITRLLLLLVLLGEAIYALATEFELPQQVDKNLLSIEVAAEVKV